MVAMAISSGFPVALVSSLALVVSTVGVGLLLASRRQDSGDPVQDLTDRVREQSRHPVRYAVTHPVETLRRKLRG